MTFSAETLIGIIASLIATLLGGGLLGAIWTGKATKASIEETNGKTLRLYQEIANIASQSELNARKDREIADARNEEIINKLHAENVKLKNILSAWSSGINILHTQIQDMNKETKPRWAPRVDDFSFLND